jgi:hypothetical protein
VSAGSRNLVVTLATGTSATLTVVDAAGRPVPGARVQHSGRGAHDEFGFPLAILSDRDGVVRFEGLHPRVALRLRVDPPRERTDLFAVTRDAWLPRDERIALERAYAVTGRVVDTGGRPVPEALVRYHTAEMKPETWYSIPAAEDGTFALGQLRAGEVALDAGAGRFFRAEDAASPERATRVAAGTRDVVLTVDLGLGITLRVPSVHPRARVCVVEVARGGVRRVDSSEGGSGERIHVQGLRPDDRVSFWIGERMGSRFVLLRDLQPGGDERLVALEPGLEVSGRVVLPDGGPASCQVTVRLLGESGPSAWTDADGRFRVLGLPEGTWPVVASVVGFRAEVQAVTSETVEIRLEATR